MPISNPEVEADEIDVIIGYKMRRKFSNGKRISYLSGGKW